MTGAAKVVEALDKILIIENDQVLISTENLGYHGNAKSAVAGLLLETGNRFIAGINLYPFLADLNNELQYVIPGWKMRITAKRRHAILKNGKTAIGGSFFVDYIAIDKNCGGNRTPRNRINIINLELFKDHAPRNSALQLMMVKAIIKLHRARGIDKIRGSRGAAGTALLKASPNWEKKRHAASKYINDHSRSLLPGNYYSISRFVEKDKLNIGSAYYIDQDNAHHIIAATTPVPHPHYIRGRGYFRHALKNTDTSFYPSWTSMDNIQGHIGLFLVRINKPHLPPNEAHLYPPWVKSKKDYVWLWTPDIQFVEEDQRLEIYSVVGGFSSTIADSVIPEYGEWSLDYLNKISKKIVSFDKGFIKGILHASYGMLAFNSSNYTKLHRYWGGNVQGAKVSLPRAGMVTERQIKIPEYIQHPICNVIARGIIEAETRRRTLAYAKELHKLGFHIPQVYADGLLVDTDELPFLPQGWRIVDQLDNLSIPRVNAFLSDQLIKLPGIPLTEDDTLYLQKRNESHKPLTAAA